MEQPHRFDEFSLQNPGSKIPDFEEQRHKHIMDKLKSTVFTTLSASNPSRPISQELKCHIEGRLHEFFPRFDIPRHPPYALMIQTAITELNEGGGSIEESISGFIEKNYEDLPWGHATFLRHHLRKLCRTGEIVCINGRRYRIAVDQGRVEEECRVEGKEDEMINKQNKEREKQVIVFEEQCQVEKQAGEEKNEASIWGTEATEQEIELCDEEEKQYQHIKMNEKLCHLRELRFDVSDKNTLSCVQKNIPEEVLVELIHEKKNEDKVMVTDSNASEAIAQSVDSDGLSTFVKEPFVELVKKKTEFQERLMETSHSLGGMELPKHNPPKPMMVEVNKDDLEVEQQQQARTPCPERASDVEASEREKQLQEQHIQGETKVLGLCCINREDLGENLRVSLGDSSLPMLKRQRKQFSKRQRQQQQQKTIIWEENKFVIVCGLQAQKKAPNSHPDNKQQQQSQDTTMAVFLPLEQQHYHQQLECQGQEWPSKREGDGGYGSLQMYVRRRRRG